MLIDLLGLTILSEKAAKNTLAAHPEDLGGQAGLTGTASLTSTEMATLALGLLSSQGTRARVDNLGLANDVAILDELADIAS